MEPRIIIKAPVPKRPASVQDVVKLMEIQEYEFRKESQERFTRYVLAADPATLTEKLWSANLFFRPRFALPVKIESLLEF